jgi:hypothetical protein
VCSSIPDSPINDVLAFHCCDKIPEKSKGGEIYFGSWFQRLQSVVIWPHCFGTAMKLTPWWRAHGGAEPLTSWQPGSRERRKEGSRDKKSHCQWLTLQGGPTFSQPIQDERVNG